MTLDLPHIQNRKSCAFGRGLPIRLTVLHFQLHQLTQEGWISQCSIYIEYWETMHPFCHVCTCVLSRARRYTDIQNIIIIYIVLILIECMYSILLKHIDSAYIICILYLLFRLHVVCPVTWVRSCTHVCILGMVLCGTVTVWGLQRHTRACPLTHLGSYIFKGGNANPGCMYHWARKWLQTAHKYRTVPWQDKTDCTIMCQDCALGV